MTRLVGPGLILLCTVIWGSAFIAQKLGADHFGPFAITCCRNLLAGVFLWVCLGVRDRFGRFAGQRSSARTPTVRLRGNGNRTILGGAMSGLVLFLAMLTQQLGIERTTPGVSAFLTANYVLLVPVFAWMVGKGRPRLGVWLGVLLALVGTYLLSFASTPASDLNLGPGEAWTLLCAALFAVQIMVVDHFAPGCDMLRFSMVQMLVAGLVALPFAFLPGELSRVSFTAFRKGLPALLYLGVFSSGIAYTLQNLGQARTPPALAAILMSLESVFGAFFGWLLLGDVLSVRQTVGCVLVLTAVLASQLLSAFCAAPSRPRTGA